MNLRNVTVVVALSLAILFLLLDKCGSTRKADELRGQYEEASMIAEVERRIKEETIREQKEKIGTLNTTIVVLNTTIKDKDRELVKIEDELGELKEDFTSLEECQAQYDKLVEGFTLAKGIIKELGKPIEYYDEHGNKKFKYPEGTVTFKLNEKYEVQVIISISYKDMYESVQGLLVIGDKQVKELEKINRRLRLTSGLKSSVAVVLAGVVLYSLLRK